MVDDDIFVSDIDRKFFTKYPYIPFYYYGLNTSVLIEYFIKEIKTQKKTKHLRHYRADEMVGYAGFHHLAFDSNIFNFKMM